MRIATTKTTVYTPEWARNKESADPVRVHYRTPTLDDRRKLIPQPRLDFQISPDGKPAGGRVELSVDVRAFVEALVEKIEGLEVEDEAGNVRQIKTAGDLLRGPATLAGLVDELGQELQRATTGKTEDEKKS